MRKFKNSDLNFNFIAEKILYILHGQVFIMNDSLGQQTTKQTNNEINELHRDKTRFLPIDVKTKVQISFTVTAKLISAFVFFTQIVQFFKSEISSF